MDSAEYRVSALSAGFQVFCRSRFRGYFATLSDALDMAETLARLSVERCQQATVVFEDPMGSSCLVWPSPIGRRTSKPAIRSAAEASDGLLHP